MESISYSFREFSYPHEIDSEKAVFQRAVSLLADELQIEAEQQPVPLSVLSFSGLEILQHQRRVLLDRRDARLTRIEPDCKNPTYLKTVLGVGYKFSADTTENGTL